MKKLYFLSAITCLALAPLAYSAGQDKQHEDVFVPGGKEENRIAREVRHQLVTLPYYGVFDDLAFRVDDGTVTLVGAVTRPTLKSDAENVTKRVEGVRRLSTILKYSRFPQWTTRFG